MRCLLHRDWRVVQHLRSTSEKRTEIFTQQCDRTTKFYYQAFVRVEEAIT
jgi:hypothetical protein